MRLSKVVDWLLDDLSFELMSRQFRSLTKYSFVIYVKLHTKSEYFLTPSEKPNSLHL